MTEREALKLALEALEAMMQEFRGYDLPYGSKAYALAKDACLISIKVLMSQSDEAQPEHSATHGEPVAWATREDFYRELDRSVNRMRQQMEIKGVVMRCADYDIALPVIDIRDGHVLVGQVTTPPQRTWVGLSDEEAAECWTYNDRTSWKNIEAKLKEKNT